MKKTNMWNILDGALTELANAFEKVDAIEKKRAEARRYLSANCYKINSSKCAEYTHRIGEARSELVLDSIMLEIKLDVANATPTSSTNSSYNYREMSEVRSLITTIRNRASRLYFSVSVNDYTTRSKIDRIKRELNDLWWEAGRTGSDLNSIRTRVAIINGMLSQIDTEAMLRRLR